MLEMLGQNFSVNDADYLISQFLGRGKSAYSFLAENAAGEKITLKILHDEPFEFYQCDDKFQAEIDAYTALHGKLPMPELVAVDEERGWLAKEYVDGENLTQLIAENRVTPEIWRQIFAISEILEPQEINIDYFPANFLWDGETLIYVDYEVNVYNSEYDWLHWGIYFWVNCTGMHKYLETGDALAINEGKAGGKPIKKPFRAKVTQLKRRYAAK